MVKKLFQRVRWVVSVDLRGAQIACVSQSREKFGKRVSSFERQSARFLRTAGQILHQQQLIKEHRRKETTALIHFEAGVQPSRASNGVRGIEVRSEEHTSELQ